MLADIVGAALAVIPSRQDRARFAAVGQHYIQNFVAAFAESGFGDGQVVAAGDAERQFSQWPAHFILLRLQAIESVQGFLHHKRCLAHLPGDITFLYREFGQVERPVKAAGFVQLSHRGRYGRPVFLFAEFPFFA